MVPTSEQAQAVQMEENGDMAGPVVIAVDVEDEE